MRLLYHDDLHAIRWPTLRPQHLNSNPLWGPRRNLAVPIGMATTALIGVTNSYRLGLQRVFSTTPIPSKFWVIPIGFALGIFMDEMRKLIARSYPKSIIAKMA